VRAPSEPPSLADVAPPPSPELRLVAHLPCSTAISRAAYWRRADWFGQQTGTGAHAAVRRPKPMGQSMEERFRAAGPSTSRRYCERCSSYTLERDSRSRSSSKPWISFS